jgi:hypothetical protein
MYSYVLFYQYEDGMPSLAANGSGTGRLHPTETDLASNWTNSKNRRNTIIVTILWH